MKSDWKLKEENEDGSKTYARVFYKTEYWIEEGKSGECTWGTDAIAVNCIYPDFESAEQDVIKDTRFEKSNIELKEAISDACKVDTLVFNFDTFKYEHVRLPGKELGTVYISGRMKGLSKERYIERFKDAEQSLKWDGIKDILNPIRFKMKHIIEENNISDKDLFSPKYRNLFLREDIKQLVKADTICMTFDYKESPGAMVEYAIARALNMNIIYYPYKHIWEWNQEWYKNEV